uniref:hypothetical protein n=1 Tax=Salmonella enterica TaxID=28901 RepID=UPI00398C7A71
GKKKRHKKDGRKIVRKGRKHKRAPEGRGERTEKKGGRKEGIKEKENAVEGGSEARGKEENISVRDRENVIKSKKTLKHANII